MDHPVEDLHGIFPIFSYIIAYFPRISSYIPIFLTLNVSRRYGTIFFYILFRMMEGLKEPNQDPRVWLRAGNAASTVGAFGEKTKEQLENLVTFIMSPECRSRNREYGPQNLPLSDLQDLTGTEWYSDTVINWAIKTLNKQSNETRCCFYINDVNNGNLKEYVSSDNFKCRRQKNSSSSCVSVNRQ